MRFIPVRRWDGAVIAEIFRWRILNLMVKHGVITPEAADNMLSWPHSGFNVHATAPFGPTDFLAKIALHIADRHQNIRRYAGFYSSNIQSRVRIAKQKPDSEVLSVS